MENRELVNSSYSSWEEVLFDVPVGSILGPLLFKWFFDNQIKANKDKCYLVFGNKDKVSMKIDNIEIDRKIVRHNN